MLTGNFAYLLSPALSREYHAADTVDERSITRQAASRSRPSARWGHRERPHA
jgi:hypothetical protein